MTKYLCKYITVEAESDADFDKVIKRAKQTHEHNLKEWEAGVVNFTAIQTLGDCPKADKLNAQLIRDKYDTDNFSK